jgi:DNA-binding CsgD family transcriptional regulator
LNVDIHGSDLERAFDTNFIALGHDLPRPVPHFQFALVIGRNFEFDRAWPDYKVAVELEGIYRRSKYVICHQCGEPVRARKKDGSLGKRIPMLGYHQHYGRFKSDVEKYNIATEMGWAVLRFLHDDVHADPFKMVGMIRKVIQERANFIPKIDELTKREDQIIKMAAAGFTNLEMSERLQIKANTVRRHSASILQKFCARNRANAVARAIAWGLLDIKSIPWQDEIPILWEDE